MANAEMEVYIRLTPRNTMRGMLDKGLIRQPKVDKIIRSGPCTIVFWMDGTKTIVRCAQDEQDNVYTAFCAALGKEIYGSNSALKREIKRRMR